MAMGRRQRHRQQAMWLATEQLPRTAGHVFYDQVNKTLTKHGFDEFAEKACQQFYADTMGRPGLAPGIYFRMQLIGYFEGIDSERGMAWRCADSLSLREFIGVGLTGTVPDHSTVSRTRRLIDLETHGSVFSWMLGVLGENGFLDVGRPWAWTARRW
jgi:transposase